MLASSLDLWLGQHWVNSKASLRWPACQRLPGVYPYSLRRKLPHPIYPSTAGGVSFFRANAAVGQAATQAAAGLAGAPAIRPSKGTLNADWLRIAAVDRNANGPTPSHEAAASFPPET
jgi:hypothetical protein